MPRYDLPNAAPEPLRLVQTFVNTVDLERDRDWLDDWFAEQGVRATGRELVRAREVREAIRELLYANNRQPTTGDPHAVLRQAADAARLTLDLDARADAAGRRRHGLVGRACSRSRSRRWRTEPGRG